VNSGLKDEVVQLHAQICAGLADPSRILILYELAHSPLNVGVIAANLRMPQPLVSRHLKVLRERGMVRTERRGAAVEYRLADHRLVDALDLLRAVLRDTLTERAQLAEAIS
jgi:ArsR family transcriptional regulator